MGRKQREVIGVKFNHLTIIKDVGRHLRDRKVLCICDCGNMHIAVKSAVTRGNTKSCGCNKFKYENKLMSSKHPYYKIWIGLRARCYNPNDKNYKYYGARGIIVCKRWLNSFWCFVSDMGIRPSKIHSVERKNNNGNYTPKNCKWGLPIEQQNNKSNNVKLTYNGITKNMSQWAKELNINRITVATRIGAGWKNVDRILSRKTYPKGTR